VTKTVVGAQEPPERPEGRLCDLHAERAALAAVVCGGPLTQHLLVVLEEGDFTDEMHRGVFAAAAALSMHARRIDPTAVIGEAERQGRSLPAELVHRLVAAVPPGATAVHYAAIIRDLAALRRKGTGAGPEGLPQIPLRGFLIDDELWSRPESGPAGD
jgi:replicative DNA helicase